MAETILSYLLAEESSNPQRISKKMGGLGIRRRRHLSYILGSGSKSPEEAAWALMQRIMGLGQCDYRRDAVFS